MPNEFGTSCDGTGCTQSIRGGSAVAGFASVMTADLTIEGVTLHYAGDRLSRDTAIVYYSGLTQIQQAIVEKLDPNAADPPDGHSQISSFVTSENGPANIFPLDLSTPYDVALGHIATLPNGSGNFTWWPDANGTALASGLLSPDHVTLTALDSNVPEPASWAMMVLGFGAIGGAMRASKRVFTRA